MVVYSGDSCQAAPVLLVDDQVRRLFAPHYRLDAVLGEGAAAVVYAAHDLRHDRPVAIKWLKPGVTQGSWGERFLREIAIAAAVQHPNIVAVLASGEVAGRPFAIMPLVRGETLRARLTREPQLPFDDVLRISSQVAAAIDHAHAHGFVHRDLKPENIMLSGDQALVLDFGIAYALVAAGEDRITLGGLAVGTPQYMSPEQAAAEPTVDGRADVYSLSCVIFEMLTGAPPFTGATTQAIRARHAIDAPSQVRVVRPSLPESVDHALFKGLAKVPADRFATCAQLVAGLRAATRPVSRRDRRLLIGAIGLGVAAFATALVFSPWKPRPDPPPTWVLLSRFQAPPGDEDVGRAVEDLMRTELAQSRYIALVTPEQVRRALRAASLPDSTTLTPERAREVAMRSTVKVVVTGEVHRLSGDQLSITVKALQADADTLLVSRGATVSTTGDELMRKISGMVREIREKLLDQQSPSLWRTDQSPPVSTPSFAAFTLYSDALLAQREGRVDGSIHLLQRAVREDSAFAAAWAALAMAFAASRQPDSAKHTFSRALAHTDRLSEAEADRLRGDEAFYSAEDVPGAIRWYRLYLEQRPLSVGGWNSLGLCLSATGRHQESLEAFLHASAIDPFYLGPRQIELLNAAAELVILGRLDSARTVSSQLKGPDGEYMRLMLLNATNRWDSLAVEAERLADSPTTEGYVRSVAQLHAAGARAALGDTTAAAKRLARIIAESHGGQLRGFVHARLLFDLARGVTPRWALPTSLQQDSAIGARFARAVHAAQRRDSAEVQRDVRALRARDSAMRRALGAGLVYLESLSPPTLAGAVVDRLLAAASEGENDPFSVDRPSSLALRWQAAAMLATSGRLAEADRMRERMRAPTGLPPSHYPLRGFVMRAPQSAVPSAGR